MLNLDYQQLLIKRRCFIVNSAKT